MPAGKRLPSTRYFYHKPLGNSEQTKVFEPRTAVYCPEHKFLHPVIIFHHSLREQWSKIFQSFLLLIHKSQ